MSGRPLHPSERQKIIRLDAAIRRRRARVWRRFIRDLITRLHRGVTALRDRWTGRE